MNNASAASTSTTTSASTAFASTSQVFSDNDSETSAVYFVQDGKTFFPLGGAKPICVVPDIFREEVRINIREYFSFPEKDFLYATKRGVNLTIEEFNVLCDNIESVKQKIKKLKKQVKKNKSSGHQQRQLNGKRKTSLYYITFCFCPGTLRCLKCMLFSHFWVF